MESEIARFLKDIVQLNTVLLLCFFTVRDSLRIPMRKISVYASSYATLVCLLYAIVYANIDAVYFSLLGITIYILGSAMMLFRAVSHKKGKLMFVLLLFVSYYYFSDNLGNTLCLLLNIPLFDITYLGATVYISCIVVTVYPFARFMGWLWARIRGLHDTSWNRLCLVPLAFIVMGGMHWEFYLAGMITGLAFPVFETVIVVSAFIIYWQLADGLSKASDAAQFAERLRSMDNQLLLQAELLKEATSHEGEIRRIRHDIRHHFATLESMFGDNGYDRTLDYLREYIDRVEETVTSSVCDNAVADSVCRRYIALAGQRNVRTDVAAAIPERPGIVDSDLAVLLGNLWENALEACGRQTAGQRYIRFRAKLTGNSLMISMKNSFDGVTRTRTGRDGEPVLLSLKRGGTEEGIGLASIHAIVGRYQGVDEVTYDANSFNVKILLYTENDTKT